MLSTDKQTDRQTDRQTNQRYQKHNLLCQGGNYNSYIQYHSVHTKRESDNVTVVAVVAVVVEWLACLPVTRKIGVHDHFYLERESNTTSVWINVGREWCCRGWSIEGGTPGGLFRTGDGLPRIRKAWTARNVHECESVCAWKKTNKHYICSEMAALYECLYVCCISLYMYMYVFKLMCVFHCTARRALMM